MKAIPCVLVLWCISCAAEMGEGEEEAKEPTCRPEGAWEFLYWFGDEGCASLIPNTEEGFTETYSIDFIGSGFSVTDGSGVSATEAHLDPNLCEMLVSFSYSSPETEELYGTTLDFFASLRFDDIVTADADATLHLRLWEEEQQIDSCSTELTGIGTLQ